MGEYLVPCFNAHLLADFSQVDKLRVHDLFTSRADNMGIGIGLGAIIAIAPVWKPKLQDLI
jgi:hypothetical protein